MPSPDVTSSSLQRDLSEPQAPPHAHTHQDDDDFENLDFESESEISEDISIISAQSRDPFPTGTMAADFSEGRLETVVDNPQKELPGTKDAYVSYQVTTIVRPALEALSCYGAISC